MIERWLPIQGFPNYEISNYGNIKNIKSNRDMSIINGGKYPTIGLHKNGNRYWYHIHVLVMETFYGPNIHGLEINHIDGNKRNNNINNLEYVSRSDNMKHAYRMNLKKPSGPHPIRKMSINEINQTFDNIHECARFIGGDYSTIAKCLKGYHKQHKGYTFKYCEE